jgi:type II secretory pathway component PulC
MITGIGIVFLGTYIVCVAKAGMETGSLPRQAENQVQILEVTDSPTETLQVLEERRFGKRIAANRWILSRDALLQFRQALLHDPDRLARLFLSMKPVRTGSDISGFRIQKQTDDAFFDAVGLKENDVVLKVNSMNMTKHARTEYFIREFVQDRLSALVLDIERDGKPMELIFYLR